MIIFLFFRRALAEDGRDRRAYGAGRKGFAADERIALGIAGLFGHKGHQTVKNLVGEIDHGRAAPEIFPHVQRGIAAFGGSVQRRISLTHAGKD